MRDAFLAALRRGLKGTVLDKNEIVTLLQAENSVERQSLFRAANLVRERHLGRAVHLRGIIEFSNHCQSDCLYCGLRRSNLHLPRYRMSTSEILEAAGRAYKLGYRTLVLQSGEDPWYDAKTLAKLISSIKKELAVALTLCVGERSREDYLCMREAGADRYLLKHETADLGLFTRLHPGRTLASRLECLHWLREFGLQIGSGNMVGLPGQTVESLAEDLLLLRELDVEMAGIGPFIPHGDTPLGEFPGGTVELTLLVLAVARLVLPQAHLPATTALGSIDPLGRQRALSCGANVIMPNVTPTAYRANYQIYPNKICIKEQPEDCGKCIKNMVTGLGREVAQDQGHSPKPRKSKGGGSN